MSPILSPIPRNSPRQSPSLARSGVGSSGTSNRTAEEMRTHITQLKAELDIERAKNKQQHRDKVMEMKALRDSCEADRESAIEVATNRLVHWNDNMEKS